MFSLVISSATIKCRITTILLANTSVQIIDHQRRHRYKIIDCIPIQVKMSGFLKTHSNTNQSRLKISVKPNIRLSCHHFTFQCGLSTLCVYSSIKNSFHIFVHSLSVSISKKIIENMNRKNKEKQTVRPKRTTKKTATAAEDIQIDFDNDTNASHPAKKRACRTKNVRIKSSAKNPTGIHCLLIILLIIIYLIQLKGVKIIKFDGYNIFASFLETTSAKNNSLMNDFSSNVEMLSSTTIDTEPPAQETQDISNSDSLEVLDDIPVVAVPQKKRKKETEKKRVPKKRNLRPEDERILKVLTEKFRCDSTGAKCQLESCTSKPMKCTRPANLKRHLSQRHPNEYANIFPNEINHRKQLDLEKFNVIQDSIELVTVNGYPFSLLEASGMHGFMKPRLQNVRSGGHMLNINRHSIVEEVARESDLVRDYIKKEMKGKIISIMFDVCTIATLSMLGVNSVFMKNDETVCRSLGTIEIKERHTAVQLANMLYDILSQFDVLLPNVFTMTSDTAKNATATSSVLNLIGSSENDNVDENLFDETNFGMDIENEAELQKVIDNVAAHTELVSEMARSVGSKNDQIVLINQVNCGTHVFQLSVNGSLCESTSKATITKVHDICILLRTQVVMIELRKLDKNIIVPPLKNNNRWNTDFIMVCILL